MPKSVGEARDGSVVQLSDWLDLQLVSIELRGLPISIVIICN
jgi:hypothetical protein